MKREEFEELLMFSCSSLSSESERDEEEENEEEEEDDDVVMEMPPPTLTTSRTNILFIGNKKRLLSKQLSMRETTREAKWEKRRRQIMQRRIMLEGGGSTNSRGSGETEETAEKEAAGSKHMERGLSGRVRSLTDEDLDELRGSIELGFGFSEEEGGHDLCDTLPALDLYFAVNRQYSEPRLHVPRSPATTPTISSSSSNLLGSPSPRSPNEPSHASSLGDSWKILKPGENPQAVKTKLRHWAQAVACSVRQCC